MKTYVRFQFETREGYNKAMRQVSDNGYRPTTCFDSGNGYYSYSDNNLFIDVESSLITDLYCIFAEYDIMYHVAVKQPTQYVIMNQGGYLD